MGTVLLICGYLYITIAVIVGITILRRIIKKEGLTARDEALPVIIVGIGFLYIIALAFHYSEEIGLSDRMQILLMFGLVAITGFYALSTAKMADEMKEQKYDSVRPIIDIERIELHTIEQTREAYGDYSKGLTCVLRNIGVGPAQDVYSFIQTDRERHLHPFGALAKNGETGKLLLSLEQRNGCNVLVAYYRDVYNRYFESSRDVKNGVVQLGPLEIRKLSTDEYDEVMKKLETPSLSGSKKR